ncbi:MAG TPA: hypothetical protein VMT85_17215 [Thermoanaerobaculia bacterium]|nr:hypothetical protein [Thermoanaerobaculia bacterium]
MRRFTGNLDAPALLVLAGLIIQVVSLPRSHPLTFTLFLLGAALTFVGSLLYLWRVLRQGLDAGAAEPTRPEGG